MISAPAVAFLRSFVLASLVTLLLVGGGAWLAARPIVGTPPQWMRTSVFEFELAPGWACVREGTEHVCRKGTQAKAAVAIMTMKERGPPDTAARYREHLSTPQQADDGKGASWTSQVISVGQRRLGGRDWIVGRHFESEVRNYTTDYYAALTSHKAILITFSAHREHMAAFEPEFRRMVESLKVFQD
jgi:hypothetical protein